MPAGTIDLRPLGRTGIKVSRVGLGTIWLGRPDYGVKSASERQVPTIEKVHTYLQGAAELGINFIDTAPAYVTSEVFLGQVFKADPDLRRKFFLATKCGNEFTAGRIKKDFSPAGVEAQIRKSIEILGGPVDLMQLHSVTMEAVTDRGLFQTLCRLRDEGLFRFIGVTNSRDVNVIHTAFQTALIDAIQVPVNLLDFSMTETFPLAILNRAGIIANRPLSEGLLTTYYVHGSEPQRRIIEQLMAERQIPPDKLADEALRFVFADQRINTVLVGTSRVESLRKMMDTFGVKP